MPAALTYPGVYVDEVPSGGARPIAAVPTSIAAFVGPVPRGPAQGERHITSWSDFERLYGGLAKDNPLSAAVYHFFLNGGAEAKIVRVVASEGATAATIVIADGPTLEAKTPGAWGNNLRVRIDYEPYDLDPLRDAETDLLYNLTVHDAGSKTEERFVNISAKEQDGIEKALAGSSLVKLKEAGDAAKRPAPHAPAELGRSPFADPATGQQPTTYTAAEANSGSDGTPGANGAPPVPTADDYDLAFAHLLKTDIFNLLCVLPGAGALPGTVLNKAGELCLKRRAFLIVDPPEGWTHPPEDSTGVDEAVKDYALDAAQPEIFGTDFAKSAAVYFPRLKAPDAADGGKIKEFLPSGAIAGLYARTDAQRGVWKAPAGTEAGLNGVSELTVKLTDRENGRLNPLGINCLRTFPGIGKVSWGARTMRGANSILDDPSWRYVPIRRLALFIEESLYRGTQWVVFEPNDEPLWSSVRLTVGAFMNTLYRQGAFQGRTPRDAYLVKCDAENNPQIEIDQGIVNILVGFAPLKPAEFVLVHIQQLASQVEA